jgi:hypothetical protein
MRKQHKLTWSTGVLVLATCGAMAAMSSVARADLVLIGATPATSFFDLGSQGFGAAPRLLTLQTNTVETGNVTPVDVVHGDAISGANKSTTPTLGALGWNTGANVGIGFNSDQSGQTGITLQSLTLTIYAQNGTTVLGTFNLNPKPINFSAADLALQPGNGNAVFDFHLTTAEQITFNSIVAMTGSSGFFAGLASSLGCSGTPSPTCQVSNDGPDSFVGFAQSLARPVPLPGALPLFVTGLVGVSLLARRKRKTQANA